MFPSLIGFLKERLSTEAVMLGALQCLPAAIAAAISIQYINLPPIKLPKTFVSFGKTSSFITVKLSLAFFDIFFYKDNDDVSMCRFAFNRHIGTFYFLLSTLEFADMLSFDDT